MATSRDIKPKFQICCKSCLVSYLFERRACQQKTEKKKEIQLMIGKLQTYNDISSGNFPEISLWENAHIVWHRDENLTK